MKNLSAYHQEEFLRNLKLTLILFLVPLLMELRAFQTWGRFFLGHPVHGTDSCLQDRYNTDEHYITLHCLLSSSQEPLKCLLL